MVFLEALRIKKRNWKVLRNAPYSHKETLLKALIISADQEKVFDSKKVDLWFGVETGINISLINLVSDFKSIENSIKVYFDYSAKKVQPEIIITSAEYKKDIFDAIMDLVFEYENKTDVTPEFYYIAEKQLPQGCKALEEV